MPFPTSALRHAFTALAALLLAALALGCGSSGGGSSGTSASLTPRPTTAPTAQAQALKRQAETQHLPRASEALAELVRTQSWFQEMTPARLNLVASLVKNEQAARSRGEARSTWDMLSFAAEQGWYVDGLEEVEAAGLAGVFDAYTQSLTKEYAPPIGVALSSTLRHKLFEVVALPETGDKVVVIASQDPALGRRAFDYARDYLPKIEAIAGPYPYPFLYIEVTKELPKEILGVSYDEFIAVRNDSVDSETVVHEITHSTVYGLFPIWFEEGLAHFIQYFSIGQLDTGSRVYTTQLQRMGADPRLDIRGTTLYTDWDYIAERAQGFLFLKGVFDIEGIEALSATVKALRTRTLNDQELLTAIIEKAPDAAQVPMRKLYCDRVIGLTRNYCVPAGPF